jgi:hypothetical protein
MNPVVRIGGDKQIVRAGFGDALLEQVAPGVIEFFGSENRIVFSRCLNHASTQVNEELPSPIEWRSGSSTLIFSRRESA